MTTRARLVFSLGLLASSACSSQAAQSGVTRLPSEIRVIVDAAPYKQVAAFAADSGACAQVYAIALTWVNAQAALGLLPDPIRVVDDLEKTVLTTTPGASIDPSRSELARLDRELCSLTVKGNREIVLQHLAELLLWSGQKDLGLSVLRASRDEALAEKPETREIHLPDIAGTFLAAGQKDEAVALASQIAKEDARRSFLRKLGEQLVEKNDCAAAKQIVESLPPREQADIAARCLVRSGNWAEAWKQIQAIPGGDHYGAKGYLETQLIKNATGDEALRIGQSLLAQAPSYSSPSVPLLRFLAAQGAPDDVLKAAAKMPGYSKESRIDPYVAVVAAYRKTGRTDEAERLLQEAKQLAEKSSNPGSSLSTLARALREANQKDDAARVQDDVIARLTANPKATTFDYLFVAGDLIGAGDTDRAASLLGQAAQKLDASSSCKNRTEIAYQYGRLQRWPDTRKVMAVCTPSDLKVGSGVDAAWRLYSDAFTVFQYMTNASPVFRDSFRTFYYNDLFMKIWFKLAVPFFWPL